MTQEPDARQQIRKPGFFRRHRRKLLVLAVPLLTAGAGWLAFMVYLSVQHEGTPLDVRPQAIEEHAFDKLLWDEPVMTNMPPQVQALLADAIYNVSGGSVSNVRVNVFSYQDKYCPARAHFVGRNKHSPAGFFVQSDMYLRQNRFTYFILVALHEAGHIIARPASENYFLRLASSCDMIAKSSISSLRGYEHRYTLEAAAEKYRLDLLISTGDYSPKLFYLLFQSHVSDSLDHGLQFAATGNPAPDSHVLSFLHCAFGFDIESESTSGEVAKLVRSKTEGWSHNDLVSQAYGGVLRRFKELRGNSPNFASRYAEMSELIQCGSTDDLYDKTKFSKDDLVRRVLRKEAYLAKSGRPEAGSMESIIRRDVGDALMTDYEALAKDDLAYRKKAYDLFADLIQERINLGRLSGISPACTARQHKQVERLFEYLAHARRIQDSKREHLFKTAVETVQARSSNFYWGPKIERDLIPDRVSTELP